jgi:HEAT repeat protein
VTEVVLAASPAVAPAASSGRGAPAGAPAAGKQPPRILELVRLAETQPPVAALQPFLDDPDARVRRAAVAFLTETAAAEAGVPLAVAAADDSRPVRHAAATGLRELASVLPAGDQPLVSALRARAASPDPVIRRAVLDVLGEMRAGEAAVFAAALADADDGVRVAAVRGLASVAEEFHIVQAAGDPSREVRIAVADGLAALAGIRPAGDQSGGLEGRRALERLAADADPLVRAAAFKAAGARGCPPPLDSLAVTALAGDAAWQARAGAAQALAAAPPDVAVPPLAGALRDPHADVRKAAVIALAPVGGHPAATEALRAAAVDSDADVRAYARHASSARAGV